MALAPQVCFGRPKGLSALALLADHASREGLVALALPVALVLPACLEGRERPVALEGRVLYK